MLHERDCAWLRVGGNQQAPTQIRLQAVRASHAFARHAGATNLWLSRAWCRQVSCFQLINTVVMTGRCVLAAVVALVAVVSTVCAQNLPVPELPYGYGDLAPVISEEMLRVHHLGHHAGYTRKLNSALATLRADVRMCVCATVARAHASPFTRVANSLFSLRRYRPKRWRSWEWMNSSSHRTWRACQRSFALLCVTMAAATSTTTCFGTAWLPPARGALLLR